MEHVFCPHRAVRELPSVTSQDHAKDEVYCTELIFRNTGCLRQKSEIYFFPQIALASFQSKLGYALLGIAGEKLLNQIGHPYVSNIKVLHHILDMAGVKVSTEYSVLSIERPFLQS